MSHHCHAHGCEKNVPPKMLMCLAHWRAVPAELQKLVWAEYRPGQENDKKPTYRYLAVQRAAVAMVAFRPKDETAATLCMLYMTECEEFRKKAIAAGEGDPLADWEAKCKARGSLLG